MADFFTVIHNVNGAGTDNVDHFAQAVASRFDLSPFITSNLGNPPPQSLPKVSLSSPRKFSPPAPDSFHCIPISSLHNHLFDSSTLILDIRPPAQYANARLPNALSLSIPSIMLKRPSCTVDHLMDMIGSPITRERFARWRDYKSILVYDTDSKTDNVIGLLRKLSGHLVDGKHYNGRLLWFKGGMQEVWKTRGDLVNSSPVIKMKPTAPLVSTPPSSTAQVDNPLPSSIHRRSNTPSFLTRPNAPCLSKSPHALNVPFPSSVASSHSLPTTSISSQDSFSFGASMTIAPTELEQPPMNPFFDTIRQNLELCHGITERIPLRLPRRVRRRIDQLPFEWLRNVAKGAMSNLQDQAESSEDSGADSDAGSDISSASSTPPSNTRPPLNEASSVDIEESMDNLAMQFYRIELAEQRRLKNVMEYHSRESDNNPKSVRTQSLPDTSPPKRAAPQPSNTFPFSITAGVEKGAKNRYRHIWPFEHARVRIHSKKNTRSLTHHSLNSHAKPLKSLRSHSQSRSLVKSASLSHSHHRNLSNASLPTVSDSVSDALSSRVVSTSSSDTDEDDYVNASYVQPMCTRKRYIATQGPLDATFGDFWTVVWQQNVHVIVMLTREVEGSQIKCGKYWTDDVTYFGGSAASNSRSDVASGSMNQQKSTGRLKLELISVEGEAPISKGLENDTTNGFFFEPQQKLSSASLIKRAFRLTNLSHPSAPPRKVVQLQYLDWPDMNVPDDSRGILDLVKEVEKTVSEAVYHEDGESDDAESGTLEESHKRKRTTPHHRLVDHDTGVAAHAIGRKNSPVLLHCSAGVGRTGGFIAVDAVLDSVRREVRKRIQEEQAEEEKRNNEIVQIEVKSEERDQNTDKDGDIVMGDMRASLSPAIALAVIPVSDSAGVVHIPVVDGGRTPMQVESAKRFTGTGDGFFSTVSASKAEAASSSTKKWAQMVSDATGSTGSEPFLFTCYRDHHSLVTGKTSTSTSTTESGSDGGSSFEFNRRHTAMSGQPRAGSSLNSSVSSFDRILENKTSPSLQLPSLLPPFEEVGKKDEPRVRTWPAATDRPQLLSSSPFSSSSLEAANTSTAVGSSPIGLSSPWVPQDVLSPGRQFRSISPLPIGKLTMNDASSNVLKSESPSPPENDAPQSNSGNEAKTINYKEPRPLHIDKSPDILSSFEEPLLEVIQDMREQRMSLCQSLRQYVFVHAVVVEGALQILDEENARAGLKRKHHRMGPPQLLPNSTTSSSTTGKPVASPQLHVEDSQTGEGALSKRPSVKRKHPPS